MVSLLSGLSSTTRILSLAERGMSRATVRCDASNPSLSSSPWMRGAPQSELARAPWYGRNRQAPSPPVADRCARVGISRSRRRGSPAGASESRSRDERCGASLAIPTTSGTATPKRHGRASRIAVVERRRSRASCCRSAGFSSARAARVLKAARIAPKRERARGTLVSQRRSPSNMKGGSPEQMGGQRSCVWIGCP